MQQTHRQTAVASGLLANMDDKAIAAVFAAGDPEVREFKPKQILFNEGDIVDGIGVMLKGTLLCQRVSQDGRMQLLRVCQPPQLLNLEAAMSRKRTSPIMMVGSVTGSYLWFNYIKLFANSNLSAVLVRALQNNLLKYLADDSIRLMNKTDVLARRTVRGRIVLSLNLMRKRLHSDNFSIGMSREEFARYLCVDRSSLSTELANMRREGLIDFAGQKFTLLFDPDISNKDLLGKR
jgi:CRP-like cAMP-binding protein